MKHFLEAFLRIDDRYIRVYDDMEFDMFDPQGTRFKKEVVKYKGKKKDTKIAKFI